VKYHKKKKKFTGKLQTLGDLEIRDASLNMAQNLDVIKD
jgi:hypothetical protein